MFIDTCYTFLYLHSVYENDYCSYLLKELETNKDPNNNQNPIRRENIEKLFYNSFA